MTVRSLYPADRPNLLLNFAKAKALDTRVLLTRNSTGRYDGADGLIKTAKVNEARFNHDPITGECTGLLVEPARTNNQPSSNIFSSGWADLVAVSLENNLYPDPFTTNTATRIIPTTTSTQHYIGRYQLYEPVTAYAHSIFLKPAGYSRVQVRVNVSTFTANLSGAGSFTNIDNTTYATKIQAFANGWYRLEWTFNNDVGVPGGGGGANTFQPRITILNNSGSSTFAGDGVSGVDVFGYQQEEGLFSTSYIPTSGSTVTRAADVVTLGEPRFSDIWNPLSGTFLVDYATPAAGICPILSVDDNTTSNRIELYTSGTSQKFTVTSGGTTQCDLTTGTVAANNTYRLSAAYASNDFSSVLNGAAPVTASTGTVPTVDRLRIGSNQANNRSALTIARIAYYPSRYPNTQLRGLTTT